jgi:hypothetical protein
MVAVNEYWERGAVSARCWLLSHQLPAKPAYFRVKIWRRLQALGAVAVKPAVYALPVAEQFQEDFEWLLKEIAEGGGEALICEARLVGGLSVWASTAASMRSWKSTTSSAIRPS